MPIKKSAKKDLRQNLKRKEKNHRALLLIKDLIKKTRKSIVSENLAQAEEFIKKAVKTLDKAAKNKIIKKNAASRKKSRLMKRLNLLKKKLKK